MSLLQDQELWSQMKQMMLSLKPTRPSLRSGIHEFQHRGRSLEFAEYREYRTGRIFVIWTGRFTRGQTVLSETKGQPHPGQGEDPPRRFFIDADAV